MEIFQNRLCVEGGILCSGRTYEHLGIRTFSFLQYRYIWCLYYPCSHLISDERTHERNGSLDCRVRITGLIDFATNNCPSTFIVRYLMSDSKNANRSRVFLNHCECLKLSCPRRCDPAESTNSHARFHPISVVSLMECGQAGGSQPPNIEVSCDFARMALKQRLASGWTYLASNQLRVHV